MEQEGLLPCSHEQRRLKAKYSATHLDLIRMKWALH